MPLPIPNPRAENKDSTELFLAAEEPEEYKAPEFRVKDDAKLDITKIDAPILYESRLSPEEEKARVGKKKVLLILPTDLRTNTELPRGLKHYIPPLGVLYIASCIRETGAQVKVLDMQVEMEGKIASDETFTELVRNENPDFVGVGATIINWDAAIHTMQLVKSIFPTTKIFVGGPHITALGTDALEQASFIDFVINGEGEEVASNMLREAVQDAPDFSRVRGLIFKTGEKAYTVTGYNMFLRDLNKIPFPAWDLVKLDHYALSPLMQFKPGRSVNMISSRG
ncbi:MAG: cobalamin B12-binding domain-containing protein, partial [archaeon]